MQNYIDVAKRFFSFYETPEMQNFGVNIALFTFLQNNRVLFGKNLPEFIETKKDTLSKIDFRTFITNSNFDFNAFLDKADPERELAINHERTAILGNFIAHILEGDNYLHVGRAYALHADTRLPSSNEDMQIRLLNEEKKKKVVSYYQIDEAFQNWPINQVTQHRVYASMGFTENNKHFHPSGFYYELIDDDKHNNANIQYIISLGEPNVDFPPYFISEKKYEAQTTDGDKITIEVSPTLSNQAYNSCYDQYDLHCKMTRFEDENIYSTTEKTIKLFHITIQDGQAIDLVNYGLNHIHNELASALNSDQGILVHCRAGLGRTGQIITEILALRDKQLESIFETNNHQMILANIREFVNKMRDCRPGLIIAPEQLFQAFHNAIEYKQLKLLCEKQATDSEKLFEQFSDQMLEKPVEKEESSLVSAATSFLSSVKSVFCFATMWNCCNQSDPDYAQINAEKNEPGKIRPKAN